jgi:mRNA-degrading endonuclease RelE of RelBE toxin-antitoxin system
MSAQKWLLSRSHRFEKLAKALPSEVKKRLKDVLEKLEVNPRDPQLKIKKLHPHSEDVYACRLGISHRLSYKIDDRQRSVVLRNVGPRENYYKDS